MCRIVIVADGPSAKGFKPPDDLTVIAVNGAIEWLSRADIWFTLDHSPANMKRMQSPREDVQYFAAVPNDVPDHVKRLERIAHRDDEPKDKHSPAWWLWRWSAVPGINPHPHRINTGNSAWGALQLAEKFGAKKVVLVGVDGTSDKRVSGGAPNQLDHLPLLFDSIAGQVPVVSCGLLKTVLPRMKIHEAMAWLTR